MTPPTDRLPDEVGRDLTRPVGPEAERLTEPLKERFGTALTGVLLYGSCLRSGALTEGVVDLYALVDSYRTAYRRRLLRVANRGLPPNVFYLEVGEPVGLRAKYAVLSLRDFEEGCSAWFHPYIWARFAQPSRLVYARDEAAAERIRGSVANAVLHFLEESAPLVEEDPFDSAALWRAGLARSYATELRVERGRAGTLVGELAHELQRRTEASVPQLDGLTPLGDGRYRYTGSVRARRRARRRWRLRSWQGRVLSLLRLMKAAFTFDGGVDYLAWKVERHTGVSVPVTPAVRRHPILHGLRLLVRLVRRGVVR